MDNFRDSYFNVTWDLTKKHLRGTFWGKQYDTGRGFAVTIVEGGQVTAPSNETVRLKWEKPDSTEGYVTAVVVDDKFLIEDIDQMFTVHGAVRSDLEIWRGGKVISSITFYVSVEKAVAVDAIESSSDFTALQEALADVGDIQAQVDAVIANATVDSEVILARGTAPTLGARLDADKTEVSEQLAETENRIDNIIATPIGLPEIYVDEIHDARQGKGSIGANITEVKTSLAQKTKEDSILRPMSMKTTHKTQKTIVSFVDDDGHSEVYSILRAIATEKSFKFNTCVYAEPLKNGESFMMTPLQLQTLQSEGHEILSHGYAQNAELVPLSESLWHREFYDSKVYLKSIGLDVNSFVYQGGSYNDRVLDVIPAYYDSAWTTDIGINKSGMGAFSGYKAKRYGLDSIDLATAKGYVDALVANGGWLCFMTHVWFAQWATPAKQQDLKDLVDYIKSKNIDIVTIKEGLEIHGNIIDYGYGDAFKDYFKVDKQGTIINKYNRWFSFPENAITFNTPPSAFRLNTVTVSTHDSNSTETQFPLTKEGMLIIRRGASNHTVQEWYPRLFKDRYYERVNDDVNPSTAWKAFEVRWIRPLVDNLEGNAITPSDNIAAKDRTITKSLISVENPNLSVFPEGKAGTYTVGFYKSAGYLVEEYDVKNTNRKWRRVTKSDGSFNPWVEYCFKKSSQFNNIAIPTLATLTSATISVDISALGVNANYAIALNWRVALPNGLMYSFAHDGTTLKITVFNATGGSIAGTTNHLSVVAVQHDITV